MFKIYLVILMKKYDESKEKKIIGKYDFIPEYNRWLDMTEQRKIAKKLENITNNEKKRDF